MGDKMFKIKNKDYREDLNSIIEKLKNRENFAFSKYADGELHILANKPVNNGEFWFIPEENSKQRQQLIDSLRFKNNNYAVGISCPCCIGGTTVHNWYKKQSGQELSHLTWANLFVNGNHTYYLKTMVPLFSEYEVVLVSNSSSNLDRLPFKVKKHFMIGKNAWVDDHNMVDELKDYINNENIENHLFLFCAGPFGNLLAHQLFDFDEKNTYLDIGSTLNVYLLGAAGKNRGYLRGDPSLNKICIWGE
tara:strand:- start:36041 stop:36784 length:744 start_codon:yes stop_codon:yes gene_type:complete